MHHDDGLATTGVQHVCLECGIAQLDVPNIGRLRADIEAGRPQNATCAVRKIW